VTPTQIVTDLTIDATAPVGAQDVIVTNPDGQKGTLPAGFTVVVAPPPPPPFVSSISPMSINQGQTVSVTVAGSNFLPGAVLSFGGSGGLTIIPISQTESQITALVGADASAPIEMKDVSVTNPDGQIATLFNAFRVTKEFPIFTGTASQVADEPSIAVDPIRPQHAIVAFNVLQDTGKGFQISACGWSESTDNGVSWQFGVLTFPLDSNNEQFQPRGDPWIRYGSSGVLYYTSMASTSTQIGIFITASSTGFASDFTQPAVTVRVIAQNCKGSLCNGTDVPSFGIIKTSTGDRLIACWVEVRKQSETKLAFSRVMTSFSNGGLIWSRPPVRLSDTTEKAFSCKTGAAGTLGTDATAAITWLRQSDDTLYARTSVNGVVFEPTTKLVTSSPLLKFGTTTDKVLSVSDAQIITGNSGLRAIWQIRDSGMSQTFIADLANPQPLPFKDTSFEKFLPGTGTCKRLAGMYQTTIPGMTSRSTRFKHTVWSIDTASPTGPVFTSGKALFGGDGYPLDSGSPYRLWFGFP
jgi:hypothetical protein